MASSTRGSAVLLPIIAAMEIGGWTFRSLRAPQQSTMAAAGIREATIISCKKSGLSNGPVGLISRPLVVSGLSRLAPRIAPFDIETFFKVHFTKVGDQTLQALTEWIEEGERAGLSTVALCSLREELIRSRGQAT
jgi:2-dehydropantoate 2-reductase